VARQLLVPLQPPHDGRVVPGGVRERLERELPACRLAQLSSVPAQLDEYVAVLRRAGDDADPGVVLGGGAHHRGAADVDRLDVGLLEERVEVRDHEVEGRDAVRLEVGDLLRLPPVGEDAAVDARMERLHPSAEHLW
jgi:hypothetical protein